MVYYEITHNFVCGSTRNCCGNTNLYFNPIILWTKYFSYLFTITYFTYLERCSGSAALASDCTGILRVKIRLTDGSQLLLWGIPAPEAWATSAPEIVWTPVK